MISYVSTRGGAGERSFEEVLLGGLAEDGGLFVPAAWPAIDLAELVGLDYPETVARLLAPFTAGCFDQTELLAMARAAYGEFRHAATAPLVQLGHDEWLLELFHGPTLAFKDFAMQLLGRMFEAVLARRGQGITIVGATSGDTGAAAVRAFAGLERIRVAILYPEGRISAVQRRQMTTASEANVRVIALQGTFDDCQNRLKEMFGDRAFRDRVNLAAVNSINWARVVAQAAYYVYAALRLGGLERPLAFAVPTGNFGDVYAGYVAKRIGLPIAKLIVATNENDILARFLATGTLCQRPGGGDLEPVDGHPGGLQFRAAAVRDGGAGRGMLWQPRCAISRRPGRSRWTTPGGTRCGRSSPAPGSTRPRPMRRSARCWRRRGSSSTRTPRSASGRGATWRPRGHRW
jgi:threonine synthase